MTGGRGYENRAIERVSLGTQKRIQTMKGKRYTTGQKIRILREADQPRCAIVEVC